MPERLLKLLETKKVHAELITFKESVKDSKSSASASNLDLNKIAKTVLFKDNQKQVYAIIIRSTEKVCKNKLKQVTNKKMQLIPFNDVIKYVGYPAGGVPPFGYSAKFFLDNDLQDDELIMAGGGTIYSLIKIRVRDLKKLCEPETIDLKQKE